MARIKRISSTPKFEAVARDAKVLNETKDCAVKAVALITGVSYAMAWDALDRAGRKARKGTPTQIIFAGLRLLGYEATRMPFLQTREIVKSYPGVHKNLKNITTHHPRRFKKAWANQPNLLMLTDRHIAAFIDGEVHDWSANNALRVTGLFYVTKL